MENVHADVEADEVGELERGWISSRGCGWTNGEEMGPSNGNSVRIWSLESWLLSRCVPKMQNLYQTPFFVDLVIDQNGAMHQLPDMKPFPEGATHPGKSYEQLDVVQKRSSEARSRFGILFRDVANYFRKIV